MSAMTWRGCSQFFCLAFSLSYVKYRIVCSVFLNSADTLWALSTWEPWVLLTDFSPLLCTVPHACVPSEDVRETSPASAGSSLDSFSSRPPHWRPLPVLGEDPRLSCRAGRTPPQGSPRRYSNASRMRWPRLHGSSPVFSLPTLQWILFPYIAISRMGTAVEFSYPMKCLAYLELSSYKFRFVLKLTDEFLN